MIYLLKMIVQFLCLLEWGYEAGDSFCPLHSLLSLNTSPFLHRLQHPQESRMNTLRKYLITVHGDLCCSDLEWGVEITGWVSNSLRDFRSWHNITLISAQRIWQVILLLLIGVEFIFNCWSYKYLKATVCIFLT